MEVLCLFPFTFLSDAAGGRVFQKEGEGVKENNQNQKIKMKLTCTGSCWLQRPECEGGPARHVDEACWVMHGCCGTDPAILPQVPEALPALQHPLPERPQPHALIDRQMGSIDP